MASAAAGGATRLPATQPPYSLGRLANNKPNKGKTDFAHEGGRMPRAKDAGLEQDEGAAWALHAAAQEAWPPPSPAAPTPPPRLVLLARKRKKK